MWTRRPSPRALGGYGCLNGDARQTVCVRWTARELVRSQRVRVTTRKLTPAGSRQMGREPDFVHRVKYTRRGQPRV